MMNRFSHPSLRVSLVLGLSCLTLGCVIDKQLGGSGDGSGDGSGGSDSGDTGDTDDATASETGLASTGSEESGEADACDAPLAAPNLSGRTLDVGTTVEQVVVAQITGSDSPELLLVTSDALLLWPGGPGGWQDDGPRVETPTQLNGPVLGATVGDFTGSPELDVALVTQAGGLEIWSGDGSGAFTFAASTNGLVALQAANDLLTIDDDLDGRDEVLMVLDSEELMIAEDIDGELVSSTIPMDFLGIDTVLTAPWPGPGDPVHVFVGGYSGNDGRNLTWGRLDEDPATWAWTTVPFIHIGAMVVDEIGDSGARTWAGIEYFMGPHVAGLAGLSLDTAMWWWADLTETRMQPSMVALSSAGEADLMATNGDEVALIDVECNRITALAGPAMNRELHAIDVDGDGIEDLIGLGDDGVAIYTSGS